MPSAPSILEFLLEAQADLERIAEHNADHAQRILDRIDDWVDKIGWGRVPRSI